MNYKGSCHCGRIAFEVEANSIKLRTAIVLSVRGWLAQLRLLTPEENFSTYTFGNHTIKHHFCPQCGIHPFGKGVDPSGNRKAAINARCLEDIDLSTLSIKHIDGRSR